MMKLRKLNYVLKNLKKEIYSTLNPMQVIQIARHPDRPDDEV